MPDALPSPPMPDAFNPGMQSLTQGAIPPVNASALKPPANQSQPAPQPVQPENLANDEAKFRAEILAQPEVQAEFKKATQNVDVPSVPVTEYKDTLDVFKQILPSLAVLGGSFTKQPLMNALSAATGAAEGFNQGQQIQAEQKMRDFHAALERVNQLNKQVDDAHAVVFDKDGNVNYEALAAYAAAHGNLAMQQALATNPVMAAQMYYDKRKKDLELDKLQLELGKTIAETDKARAEAEKARKASTGGAGALDEDAIQQIVDEVKAGDLSGLKGLGYGTTGSANRAAVRNALGKSGVTGQQLAAAELAFKSLEREESTLGQRAGLIRVAATEANSMADLALKASETVGRTPFLSVNELENYAKTHTGDTNIVKFNAANTSFVNAYVRAVTVTGATTDQGREHAYDILNTGFSKGQYDAAVEQLKQEMKAAVDAPDEVRDMIMGDVTKDKTKKPAPVTYQGFTIERAD